MKKLATLLLCCLLLFGCATSNFTSQDKNRSKALAILSDYTPSILLASALPLDYYCKHHKWPSPSQLTINREILSPLTGLNYSQGDNDTYIANFAINSKQAHDHFISFWQLSINVVDLKKQQQKIPLIITNKALNIKLMDYLNFKCPSEKPNEQPSILTAEPQ